MKNDRSLLVTVLEIKVVERLKRTITLVSVV